MDAALIARLRTQLPLVGAAGLAVLSCFNVILAALAAYSWRFGSDFREPYAAARIGLSHGWDHIYDIGLQRAAEASIAPGQAFEPYFNPPILAWICAPLAELPYIVSFGIWIALEAVSLGVAVWLIAGRNLRRSAIYAGSVLAVLSLALAIAFGQPVMIVALAVIASWRLIKEGHPLWAGVALAAIDIKPQLALVVPLALAVAGHWRPAAAWAAVSVALAAASLISLGTAGTHAYLSLLASTPSYLGATPRWSPAGLINGPLGVTFEAILAAAGAATVIRFRRHGPEVPMAVGCLISLLVAPYLHTSDLITAVIAIWLLHEARLPQLRNFGLGLLWLAVAIGTQFPISLIIGDALLFGRLTRRRGSDSLAPGATLKP